MSLLMLGLLILGGQVGIKGDFAQPFFTPISSPVAGRRLAMTRGDFREGVRPGILRVPGLRASLRLV